MAWLDLPPSGAGHVDVVDAASASSEGLDSAEVRPVDSYAYLKFGDSNGSAAVDSTGNSRNGTLENERCSGLTRPLLSARRMQNSRAGRGHRRHTETIPQSPFFANRRWQALPRPCR